MGGLVPSRSQRRGLAIRPTPARRGSGRPQGSPLRDASARAHPVGDGLVPSRSQQRGLAIRPTPARRGSGRPQGSPLRDASARGTPRRRRACPVPQSTTRSRHSANAGSSRIRASARVAPTGRIRAGHTPGATGLSRPAVNDEVSPFGQRRLVADSGDHKGRPYGTHPRGAHPVGDGLVPSRSQRRGLAIRPTPARRGSGRPQGSPLRDASARGIRVLGDGPVPSRGNDEVPPSVQRRHNADPAVCAPFRRVTVAPTGGVPCLTPGYGGTRDRRMFFPTDGPFLPRGCPDSQGVPRSE